MQLPRVRNLIADAKPRILLADDHSSVLKFVAELLADDFEIVAAVADGRQALELTQLLQPDIAILDVTMPILDGFETTRELRSHGSTTKIILLTMHESDELVNNAIRSGAQGYVPKTYSHHLANAIDHVLADRVFVPSLTSLSENVGSAHTVHFHMNDQSYLDNASQLVGATLRSGESIVVAGTEQTRTGIAQRLEARGIDLTAMMSQGQYIAMDAAESLSQFMRNGRPDADGLADIVASLDRLRVSTANPQARLTVFGEMAALLYRDGNIEASVEVERIWNALTRSLQFLTICSYPVACFQTGASGKVLPSVCGEHSAACHTFA
jgi:DNA-binding NarL/FixJ family response regulator